MMIGSKPTLPSDEPFGGGCTPSERRKSRRYMIEMAVAVVAYTAAIFFSASIIDRLPHGPLKVAVALLPMIGVLLMTSAMIRFVARVDEMQRHMLVQSAAVAATGTAVVSMALGFLENAGVPRVSMIWVWPLIAVFIGISLPFIRRRYR